MVNRFPTEVIEKLKAYVYRLIDPRNGETFYVGRGKGDRVFNHIQIVPGEFDEINDKIKRIREIQDEGFEVAHVIHRHGMSDEVAIEVEAALIEAYPGLTNIAGGEGNDEFGVMHSESIIRRYSAIPAEFVHRLLLISLNQTYANQSLLDQTRYAWRLSKEKAEQAEYVLAVRQGIILDAFIALEWLPATTENFERFQSVPGKWAFNGHLAPEEIRSLYRNKRIPDNMIRKRGAANPIRYSF